MTSDAIKRLWRTLIEVALAFCESCRGKQLTLPAPLEHEDRPRVRARFGGAAYGRFTPCFGGSFRDLAAQGETSVVEGRRCEGSSVRFGLVMSLQSVCVVKFRHVAGGVVAIGVSCRGVELSVPSPLMGVMCDCFRGADKQLSDSAE